MSEIKMLFSEWLGKSPEEKFGFRPKLQLQNKPFYLEQPMEPFKSTELLKELVNLGQINQRRISKNWDTELLYGEGVGKMQVDVSPLGSFKIILRRYINDLKGNYTGICRYVQPLVNDFNHKGPNDPTEQVIADKLHQKLTEMDAEPLPTPMSGKVKEFEKVVHRFASAIKNDHPLVLVYEGLNRMDENNYLMSFTYRGFGNGLPNSNKAEKFLINWQYMPTEGLIRTWGYEVVSKSVTRTFIPTPSEWDEYFTPTQPSEVIVGCIKEAFMTY